MQRQLLTCVHSQGGRGNERGRGATWSMPLHVHLLLLPLLAVKKQQTTILFLLQVFFFFCFSFFVLLSRSTVFPPFKIILAWKLKTCSLGNSIRVWTGGWQKHCHSFSYSFVHSLTLIFMYSLARCTVNCLQKALLGDNFPIVVVVWIKKKTCSLIKKFHHFYWKYSPHQAAQN